MFRTALEELADVVEKAPLDKAKDVRVILIYATGKGFNAGKLWLCQLSNFGISCC